MQQPTTQTVYDLFNGRIQFVVPVYQRAYVWDQEDNWAVLWDDILDTTTWHLDALGDGYRHFLGPIVLYQQHFEPGAVDPRLVVDGQQRLTTVQVLLATAASVARDIGASEVADELSLLTSNRGRTARGDLRFKVRPSRRDRTAFVAAMEAEGLSDEESGILGAVKFFRSRIWDWVTTNGAASSEERLARMQSLQVCLESLLYVVSINLDESDNAQVIFETLNARGTGLGALDLVKNAAFLQAEKDGSPAEILHDSYWEPTFEADGYWIEEVRQGREKRDRADWFLMHWLAMERGKVVRADKLFDTFRKDILRGVDAPSMEALIPRLCQDARVMRSFDDFEPGSPEALFFSRLDAMDTTTLLPVALFLFRSEGLTAERRMRALRALESWLVRRAILRLTTSNYNRVLTALINGIRDSVDRADEAVISELKSSEAKTASWPDDDELRARLAEGDLYGYLAQSRVRMLLEACELDVRDPVKTESIALPAGLTIEHAMPVAWQENWPVDAGNDEAMKSRLVHVNRLGNLTLVTQALNSSMSNAAWRASSAREYSKRDELTKRSVLLINQRLCMNEHWDEQLIDERGADLTGRILRTWPGPTSDVWS